MTKRPQTYPMRAVRATKESREQLAQREKRCSVQTEAQVAVRLLRSRPAGGPVLTTEEVMKWFRGEPQRFGERFNGKGLYLAGLPRDGRVHSLTTIDKSDRDWPDGAQEVYAKKNKDGISWSACLWNDGDDQAPCDPERVRDEEGMRARRAGVMPVRYPDHPWPFQHRIRRCPCSEEDRVAIDALLEVGDKRAEKLAKDCAKGGGVLEGLKKRRRRR